MSNAYERRQANAIAELRAMVAEQGRQLDAAARRQLMAAPKPQLDAIAREHGIQYPERLYRFDVVVRLMAAIKREAEAS